MKKILILCLLLSCVCIANAQQQYTLYYENGKKALEGKWTYAGSMPVAMNDWAASIGRLEKNSRQEAPDDYRLGFQSSFLSFIFDGQIQFWYPDGKLLRKVNYRNGLLNGAYESYYGSGKPYCKGAYVNGMADGEWIFYYADGKPISKTHYKAYTQKQLEEIVKSERFRKYREMNPSRSMADIRLNTINLTLLSHFNNYISRIPKTTIASGQQLFFTKNGKKEAELNYKDGARHGSWIRYDEGEQIVEARYEMDSLVALIDRDGKDVLTNTYFAESSDVVRLFNTRRQQEDYERRNVGTNHTDPNGIVPPAEAEMGTPDPGVSTTPSVFTYVSQMPEFPGDIHAWIKKNLVYPEREKKDGVEERIYVRFIVGEDGAVSGVEVLRGVNEALKKEAIRLVKAMPKWKPGKNNGTPVAVYFNLPIIFKLE